MNRSAAAAIPMVLLVVLVSLAVGAGTVAGAQPSIANVTVSPQEPLPGELVRFTTTIRNAEGADGSFEVSGVWIREAGTTDEYARVNDAGNVQPGSSIEVPLTTSFDSPGVKELRVRVNVVDEDDELTQLEYPVTVVVSERRVQLSTDIEDPVVGATTEVNVTVSNGGADPLRQLDLRVGGEGVSAEQSRRLIARLDAGEDRTFTYDVTFTEAGRTQAETVLRYATTSGQTRAVRENQTVSVDELRDDVAVDARIVEGGGANPPLAVEVTNFGNAPLEDVSVRVSDGDRTVARRAVAPVDPSASREVRLDLSDVDDAELDVTAVYETGGVSGEATTSVRYGSQPGRIELTGVDYSREGGVTTVSGSASNVGLSDVNSVVLRVLPADGVEPAAPNREYFVGTVPASDFVSFDLTARIDENVTAVPVRVTYLADGVEREETVSVPYEPDDGGEERSSGGGPGVGTIAVLAVVLVGAGGGVLWWWRRGGGGG